MTTTDDILPRWLSTKEAAVTVLFWLDRQPDKALNHLRILCELAELPDCLRDHFIRPLDPYLASRGLNEP
jgi:hypothetical protein